MNSFKTNSIADFDWQYLWSFNTNGFSWVDATIKDDTTNDHMQASIMTNVVPEQLTQLSTVNDFNANPDVIQVDISSTDQNTDKLIFSIWSTNTSIIPNYEMTLQQLQDIVNNMYDEYEIWQILVIMSFVYTVFVGFGIFLYDTSIQKK